VIVPVAIARTFGRLPFSSGTGSPPRIRLLRKCPFCQRLKERKPSPAELALPTIHEDRIRQGIREALQITKGCRVEVIMKDNHTIGNNPQNVIRWCRIAQEEAAAI